MTNRLIPSAGGYPVLVYYYDGEDWRPALLDTSGHLQIDVLSTVMDEDAATEATLAAVKDRIGALTAPAAGSVLNRLAAILGELYWLEELGEALSSQALDQFRVDIISSALPTGAATAAHQVTQTTALQLIDNLYNALHSVNTDELVVRGEDQLFSYYTTLRAADSDTHADGTTSTLSIQNTDSLRTWVVTNISVHNTSNDSGKALIYLTHDATDYRIEGVASIAKSAGFTWTGKILVPYQDYIKADLYGLAVDDAILLHVLGYKMTTEA